MLMKLTPGIINLEEFKRIFCVFQEIQLIYFFIGTREKERESKDVFSCPANYGSTKQNFGL